MFDLALAWTLLATPRPAAVAFPAGFVWGTATAAVQCEGGTNASDWQRFSERPGTIKGAQRIGDAARHWDLYERDFAQAQAMHTNGYRFSIEWSRLEPRRGAWDRAAVRHYRAMLRSLRARGIRPMVTLHHFSNPEWVAEQGGWLNPATVDDYANFAARAASAFGDLVDEWITFNEPTFYAADGYISGEFPPGHHGEWAAVPEVLANILKAHARAYHSLHRLDTHAAEPGYPACQVGIAENILAFQPAHDWNPLDRLVCAIGEQLNNFDVLDAADSGHMRLETGFGRHYEDRADLQHTLDFVGVNYYTRWRMDAFSPLHRLVEAGCPTSDLGLEVYPDGLYDVLCKTYDRYHVPLYVTETGLADAGRTRVPAYMVHHLARLGRAIARGVPVRGIYWWSLLDNFEWENGYTGGRFGLLAVDFSRPDKPRRWTPGASMYRQIARANGLSSSLLARYGEGAPGASGLAQVAEEGLAVDGAAGRPGDFF